ncbi:MAG TPA: hypothetical protein VNT02_11950, partial [Burkholderiales bacterium]|nr:hypothetical protein [Burkholderiales bacterium]
MESKRLILFFVFSFSLFLLLDAWQRDQHPVTAPATQATDKVAKPTTVAPPVPSDKLVAPPAPPAPPQGEPGTMLAKGDLINVETDVYRAQISA